MHYVQILFLGTVASAGLLWVIIMWWRADQARHRKAKADFAKLQAAFNALPKPKDKR